MGREIEWRFLVTRLPRINTDVQRRRIVQAYMGEGSPAARVRIDEDRAYLTIKAHAKNAESGRPAQRHEFEYEIPLVDAEQLVALCGNRIEKVRYDCEGGIELDVFEGRLAGLVIAEVEVEEEGSEPQPPADWQWKNISGEKAYSNQSMAFHGAPPGWIACERQ